jgi:sec-independent protein translocase protein TatB
VLDLSFGELLVIALVLLVVVGPRELPGMLRKLGQGIAKLRNMSGELRAQSGIDQMLREEGLDKDLEALRSLSRGRVVDAIVTEATREKPVPDAEGTGADAPATTPSDETPAAPEASPATPDAPSAAPEAPSVAPDASSAVPAAPAAALEASSALPDAPSAAPERRP